MVSRGSTRGHCANCWANDVGGDPLDEIMGYLGLGVKPSEVSADKKLDGNAPDSALGTTSDGERLLATSGSATLWLTRNSGAEWIEVRGPFATVRATRSKAKLLVEVQQNLERWADGEDPELKAQDLSIRSLCRFGTLVLEVSYRTWKPMRVTRDQARAIIWLMEHVRSFARS